MEANRISWLFCVASLLILLQALEIKGAFQKTTHGKSCTSSCAKGLEDKYWCENYGTLSTYGSSLHTSHCSPAYKTTYFGKPCSSECESYVGLYYYCDTADGWDYCGPTIP